MPLNVEYLRALDFGATESVLTDRDVMLYALSIGLGRNPMDTHDLRFVYEKDLRLFPTMPLVVGHPGNWTSDPRTGITRARVVHGAQRLTHYADLPIGTPIVTTNRITDILDKGSKGAIVVMQRESRRKSDQVLLSSSESLVFCRADGGFGGPSGPDPPFVPAPERNPDIDLRIHTEPRSALLYRLNQDRNPLHADPDIARSAGFPQPILHGLCTLGMVAVELGRLFKEQTLRSIETRFSKPVLPGEILTAQAWNTGGSLLFRVHNAAGEWVLDKGRATFA